MEVDRMCLILTKFYTIYKIRRLFSRTASIDQYQ